MSAESARAMLKAASLFGSGDARELADAALDAWDAVDAETEDPAERKRRLSAARSRRYRHAPARDGCVTQSVTERDASVTERDGERDGTRSLKSPDLKSCKKEEEKENGKQEIAPVTPISRLSVTERDSKRDAGKRGTRAPSSTDPSAAEFCLLHGIPPPVPGSESASFLDYWSQRVRDATSLDWKARWRCRPAWTRPEKANGKGSFLQPTGGLWQSGEGTRKVEDI